MGIYYSIQTKKTWEHAQSIGYLIGNEKYIDKDFKKPYQWLIKQMNKRIKHNNYYPI